MAKHVFGVYDMTGERYVSETLAPKRATRAEAVTDLERVKGILHGNGRQYRVKSQLVLGESVASDYHMDYGDRAFVGA